MKKLIALFCLIVLFVSCDQKSSENITISKTELELTAQRVLNSDLFKETARSFKEIHASMLKGVRSGGKVLTQEELLEYSLVNDKEVYLKEKGYPNASEIAGLVRYSDKLRQDLLIEFNQIESEIGTEKFQELMHLLDTNARSTFTLTAEEALSLNNPINNY